MTEPVHPSRPLNGHDDALQPGQKIERKGDSSQGENRGQHHGFWSVRLKHQKDEGGHQVPDDQDREIGRAIVSPVMGQDLSAGRAFIDDLEIAVKQVSFATFGAFEPKPVDHGGSGRAVDFGHCRSLGHVVSSC